MEGYVRIKVKFRADDPSRCLDSCEFNTGFCLLFNAGIPNNRRCKKCIGATIRRSHQSLAWKKRKK